MLWQFTQRKQKNNLKRTWLIMKDIISKINPRRSSFYVNDSGDITDDEKEIAENFNSLFINVGPNLVKKISPTSQSPPSFMTRNCDSMVVLPVNQSEIIDIIKILSTAVLSGMQFRQCGKGHLSLLHWTLGAYYAYFHHTRYLSQKNWNWPKSYLYIKPVNQL